MDKVTYGTSNDCFEFHVLSEMFFYPIHYSDWIRYFDVAKTTDVLKLVKQSVAIHFWNKLSKKQLIVKNSKDRISDQMYGENAFDETALGIIAKANCPLAYGSSGDTF